VFGPFIYNCEHSIEVYETTKSTLQDSELADRIGRLAWAYHSTGDLIPHTAESLWSGHFFPWAESWNELQIAVTLAFFGMYKQAMVSLRMGFELGLLSVYWNLFDDGHEVIQEWIRSKEETPRFGEIWDRLKRHPNFEWFQDRMDLRARLLALGDLHNYVHSRGARFSNTMGLLKTNYQTYEEELLQRWGDTFEEVIRVLAIAHLIKYPIGTIRYDYSSKFGIDTPMFGGLNESEVDRLEEILGQPTFFILQELANRDEHTQSLIAGIMSLPDMTDQEVDEQIVDFDKLEIENMGVSAWLKMQNQLMEGFEDPGLLAKWKSRNQRLAEWGSEMGYDKPAWQRGS